MSSYLERLWNGISVQRMFTRCMTFIHVCYLGIISVLKICKIINMFFLWILGLSPEFYLTFHYLQVEAHIVLRQNSNDLSIMSCKCYHSFIIDLFLFVNYFLYKATYKKDILSIDIWLVLHSVHFLYIVFSICVYTITCYCFKFMYACIYCIYLLLVISFRMEEHNNSIFHKIMNYFYRML